MKHNCIIKYLLAISLHFLFFQRNTWAQIKLDELKNKAIEKADKSISSLNINDLILTLFGQPS